MLSFLPMIGVFLLALVPLFFFSRIWFHLIEGIGKRIRGLFFPSKASVAWHTLEEAEQEEKKKESISFLDGNTK